MCSSDLVCDPGNQAAQQFKAANDKMRADLVGRSPSPDAIAKLPQAAADRVSANTKVQNGKILYQAGKLDDAEKELNEAIKLDPGSQAAYYYLNLIREERHRNFSLRRENQSRNTVLAITPEWTDPGSREKLPVPNSYNPPHPTIRPVHTGPLREKLYAKLRQIRIEEWKLDGIPLGDAIKRLSDEAQKQIGRAHV